MGLKPAFYFNSGKACIHQQGGEAVTETVSAMKNIAENFVAGVILRLEHAISPVPLTLPAHASLLTGLDPPQHGVRHNSIHRLDEAIPTLAERLRASGYATAAVVGAQLPAGGTIGFASGGFGVSTCLGGGGGGGVSRVVQVGG